MKQKLVQQVERETIIIMKYEFFKKALLLAFFSLYLIVSRVGVKIRNKANAG